MFFEKSLRYSSYASPPLPPIRACGVQVGKVWQSLICFWLSNCQAERIARHETNHTNRTLRKYLQEIHRLRHALTPSISFDNVVFFDPVK